MGFVKELVEYIFLACISTSSLYNWKID